MDQAVQTILENNEQVEWEGKQDGASAVAAGFFGLVILAAIGAFVYFIGTSTTGTCKVNGVVSPMEECNKVAHYFSYGLWVLAVLTPFFAYWRQKVTSYFITNKRLIIKSGFVGADLITLYYDQVRNIFVNVGILGKILGTGSIMIDTGKTRVNNKGTHNDIVYDRFDNIKKPYETYKILQEKLSANKSALYSGKGI